MNLQDIHFHDSVILEVIEDSATDVLAFKLSYPIDWDNDVFEQRILKFTDVLNYRVCEGPFSGAPTMLGYTAQSTEAGRTSLKIETNAGYRELCYKEVELCPAT